MQTLLKRKYGVYANHKRVYRLMKQMNLLAVIRRKTPYTVYADKVYDEIPNILNRKFGADLPNRKWVTDITYLTVNGQRMYLSAILDLFNNEVGAYNVGRHPTLEFVVHTVTQAVTKCKPNQVILHTDQGGQYTSRYYAAVLRSYGITQSMSRRGNCLDNAVIENFFSHFKSEMLYTRKITTLEQLKSGSRQVYIFLQS